jgi:4a-hydroxytetrahydrobiopterin dehydratase
MGDEPAHRMSAKAFHQSPGVEDWRVLYFGAYAFYRTDSFATAARFVAAIAEVAASVGHDPDVDVRPEGVTIHTFTKRDGSLSSVDAELAARVSTAAHELALTPDPTNLQVVGIAVAQDEAADTRPFWAAAFGYEDLDESDAIDPNRRGPHLWFHTLEPSKPGRGRVHIDVSVPADVARSRVEAALAAGGRLADDSHVPEWWTLASPENHGVDIAAWPDEENFED